MDDNKDSIKEFLSKVVEGTENIINVSRKVLADGKESVELRLSRRQINDEPPQRGESPRRAHTFHTVRDFTEYIKGHITKEDDVVVLADTERRIFNATLNEQSKTGFEMLQLVPKIHPLYEPWRVLLEERQVILGKLELPVIQEFPAIPELMANPVIQGLVDFLDIQAYQAIPAHQELVVIPELQDIVELVVIPDLVRITMTITNA